MALFGVPEAFRSLSAGGGNGNGLGGQLKWRVPLIAHLAPEVVFPRRVIIASAAAVQGRQWVATGSPWP